MVLGYLVYDSLNHLQSLNTFFVYDRLYTNGNKIGHGGFLQIIPVLGGLQIWLTYQNLANNFAERSVEEKINFSPDKYPKEVRER